MIVFWQCFLALWLIGSIIMFFIAILTSLDEYSESKNDDNNDEFNIWIELIFILTSTILSWVMYAGFIYIITRDK